MITKKDIERELDRDIAQAKEKIQTLESKKEVLKDMMVVGNELLYKHMHSLKVTVVEGRKLIIVHVPKNWLILQEQEAIIEKWAKDVHGEKWGDWQVEVQHEKFYYR